MSTVQDIAVETRTLVYGEVQYINIAISIEFTRQKLFATLAMLVVIDTKKPIPLWKLMLRVQIM